MSYGDRYRIHWHNKYSQQAPTKKPTLWATTVFNNKNASMVRNRTGLEREKKRDDLTVSALVHRASLELKTHLLNPNIG